MNFAERNAAWTGAWREFRQTDTRASAPRVWRIGVFGNEIQYYWGQLGGSLQFANEFSYGVNLGKKNEVPPAAHALELAREKCRKRFLEGYREVDGAGNFLDPEVSRELDFENLPSSLCFYKPDNSMGAGMQKKAERGEVLYTRKRNGLMHVITRGTGEPKIYSRRMFRQHDDEKNTGFTWDNRFRHIVDAASLIMPHNSILLGELVMDRGGEDDFKHVQSVTKSLTLQSLMDQEQHGWVSFYIWDIAFWNGQNLVSTMKVGERYEMIHELDFRETYHALLPIEIMDSSIFPTPDAALEFCKKRKWEGFVTVDPEGVYGDKAFNFKGKPDRPGSSCSKLKPEFEDDFVAIFDPENGYGERSKKGQYAGGIGCVGLYQYNTKGELVFIANVSSGLTKEQKSITKPFREVWQVLYTDRRFVSEGDDTNALDFPRYGCTRTDKTEQECVNERL